MTSSTRIAWLSPALAAVLISFSAPAAEPQARDGDSVHTEFTAVPFVGGDSDVGLGGGVLGSWARVSPAYEPYLLRIEFASSTTFKTASGLQVPYTDEYLLLHLPHVVPRRLELRLRVAYTRESQLNYNGLGNAASVAPGHPASYFRYRRTHPTAEVELEYRLSKPLRLDWGASYTHNFIAVPDDSQLARDMREGSATVRDLLGSASSHGVVTFSYGLGWDDRDDQVSAHRGQHHTLRLDLSPGGTGFAPHRFGRVNLSASGFVPLLGDRLTFAVRAVSDWLFGDAPFYKLPRYDSTSALGGSKGVRGIPAQRYSGKIKLFGNLELRSELFEFRFLGKKNVFGLTAFVDAGRVFADYHPHPELDGRGLGLKYGLGGGPRITAGQSFVLRIDVAWSKEASPIAAYLASGHQF